VKTFLRAAASHADCASSPRVRGLPSLASASSSVEAGLGHEHGQEAFRFEPGDPRLDQGAFADPGIPGQCHHRAQGRRGLEQVADLPVGGGGVELVGLGGEEWLIERKGLWNRLGRAIPAFGWGQ